MIIRIILATLFWVGFVFLSLAVLERPADELHHLIIDRGFILTVVGTSTAAVVYVFLSYRSITGTRKKAQIKRASSFVDLDEIDRFRDPKGGGTLQWPSASAYLDGVMYPNYLFERITESAVPWHRSVRMSSTYTVSIGRLPSSVQPLDLVIPLFLFPRGQLQDGLRVFEGGDKRVSTIPQRHVVAFSAAVARDQIRGCGKAAYREYLESVEPTVLSLWTSDQTPSRAALDRLRAEVLALPAKPKKRRALETAAGYLIELARFHPVCVAIGHEEISKSVWPHIFRFRLEHRIIPEIRLEGQWLVRKADWLRLVLGVELNRINIPLVNAVRARSYHLEVAGPEGTYLASQELIGVVETAKNRVRMQPRRAQRRAHLYLQGVEEDEVASEAQFQTAYFERSPGSFAMLTASAISAYLLACALAYSRGFDLNGLIDGVGAPASNLATSVLAALLALPIGVATWNRARQPLHPSLLSRFLTFAVIALSFATFVVAVIGIDSSTPQGVVVWVAILTALFAVSLLSVFSWVLRLAFELRFARRVMRNDSEEISLGDQT